MKRPHCKICDTEHYSHEPHCFKGVRSTEAVQRQDGPRDKEPAKGSVAASGCPECGATTEIFEDAAKWAAERERRRRYMKKRRATK